MRPGIPGRKIASPSPHTPEDLPLPDHPNQHRPNPFTITLGARQLDKKRMGFTSRLVFQENRPSILDGYDNIDVTISINVALGGAAVRPGLHGSRADRGRGQTEITLAVIQVKKAWLQIAQGGVKVRRIGMHMPIGDKKIVI